MPERDNDAGGDRLFDNLQCAFKFRRNCYHLQIIAGNCHDTAKIGEVGLADIARTEPAFFFDIEERSFKMDACYVRTIGRFCPFADCQNRFFEPLKSARLIIECGCRKERCAAAAKGGLADSMNRLRCGIQKIVAPAALYM